MVQLPRDACIDFAWLLRGKTAVGIRIAGHIANCYASPCSFTTGLTRCVIPIIRTGALLSPPSSADRMVPSRPCRWRNSLSGLDGHLWHHLQCSAPPQYPCQHPRRLRHACASLLRSDSLVSSVSCFVIEQSSSTLFTAPPTSSASSLVRTPRAKEAMASVSGPPSSLASRPATSRVLSPGRTTTRQLPSSSSCSLSTYG